MHEIKIYSTVFGSRHFNEDMHSVNIVCLNLIMHQGTGFLNRGDLEPGVLLDI